MAGGNARQQWLGLTCSQRIWSLLRQAYESYVGNHSALLASLDFWFLEGLGCSTVLGLPRARKEGNGLGTVVAKPGAFGLCPEVYPTAAREMKASP